MKSQSRTGGQHDFARIPSANIQRSAFDRSCGVKQTMDAGFLVPMFVDEALPGDTMAMDVALFGRIATLLHPIMDNMYLDTFWFAVPMRLLWQNWERFMGAQDDPGDSTDFTIPVIDSGSSGGYANESLHDYLGLPTKEENIESSVMFHRAYNLIYNEWFRSEDLQDSVAVNVGDGPDVVGDYTLLRRGKRHDYFTACMPWPQKGDAIDLPLGTSAPVTTTMDTAAIQIVADDTDVGPIFKFAGSGEDDRHLRKPASNDVQVEWSGSNWDPSSGENANWDDANLEVNVGGAAATGTADLTGATTITINALREGFQIQRLLERDARGGTRYTEVLRSHFGVVSPDQRLQRPEYLGGGSTPLMVQQVADTAGFTLPQANLSAFGTVSSVGGKGWRKSFTEHCVIIGLVSLRADLNYQQGLERMYSRSTKYDFYWPSLAHLGEQEVLRKEIFADGSASDDDVFGYQERWAEYRYKPSRISGKFRSNDAVSLDIWHLAQDFDPAPVLDSGFIVENPPVDRVVAVSTEPDLLLDMFFKYRCARPMPTYGVPGMIDHL